MQNFPLEELPPEVVTMVVARVEYSLDLAALSHASKMIHGIVLEFVKIEGSKLDKWAVGIIKALPKFLTSHKISPFQCPPSELASASDTVVVTHVYTSKPDGNTNQPNDVFATFITSATTGIITQEKIWTDDICKLPGLLPAVPDTLFTLHLLENKLLRSYLLSRVDTRGEGPAYTTDISCVQFCYNLPRVDASYYKKPVACRDMYYLCISFKLVEKGDYFRDASEVQAVGLSPLAIGQFTWKDLYILTTECQFTMKQILDQATWMLLTNEKWLAELKYTIHVQKAKKNLNK